MSKTGYPKENLPLGFFAGGGNIAGVGADLLRDFLNDARLENRRGIYPIHPRKSGAYPRIADAIGEGLKDVPITVPRSPIVFVLSEGQHHEVDIVLPKTHSFIFYSPGHSVLSQSNPIGGILRGRLGVENYKQNPSPDRERTYVSFVNVSLGEGGVNDLILEAKTGWNWFMQNVLFYGASWRATHDPSITDWRSAINLFVHSFKANSFQDFSFQNASLSTARTRLNFVRGMLFGVPDIPSRMFFDGDFLVEFNDVHFSGFSNTGTVFDAAAGSTGNIEFSRTFWNWIAIFAPFTLFGANMNNMYFEWIGNNVFGEEPGFSAVTFDLGGNIGTHIHAPELIGTTVPSNPQVGTRRRDVGGTEKDLFWNGSAWV